MKGFKLWVGLGTFMIGIPLCFGTITGSMSEKAILERIKPVGEVTVEGITDQPKIAETKIAPEDIGKHRYEETCHICHDTGVADAPKLGDKKAWDPRIAEGMDTMVKRAMEGYKAMPPKGTCMTCDEEEIKKTIEYMISKAK